MPIDEGRSIMCKASEVICLRSLPCSNQEAASAGTLLLCAAPF